MADNKVATDARTLNELAETLSVGDTFCIYAWDCKVTGISTNESRPYVTFQKRSVSGYMTTSYRMDTNSHYDDEFTTAKVKADRKHGWDEKFACDVADVQITN